MENKRMTTSKTKIKSIIKGKFVKGEGFNPSYILTSVGQKLSRVRVIATVTNKFVSENGKFASITIDDGTETIRATFFRDQAEKLVGKTKEEIQKLIATL